MSGSSAASINTNGMMITETTIGTNTTNNSILVSENTSNSSESSATTKLSQSLVTTAVTITTTSTTVVSTTTTTTTTTSSSTTTTTATVTTVTQQSTTADNPLESAEESEDESEILEESPCGRWLKRREEVEQRDVPGIDSAYLAMDTEEGVEVVWNEVQFSERKNFKAQEEKIQLVFENLTKLEHPNIVKFHRYWTDTHNDKPRVIFITEYMSSGSLKQFLKRTKRNVRRLPLPAWKRWCTQILSALSYLHSCVPPIIHGNLTCDTIFIQHNGLVKIGSVAPDSINHHVKTCRENIKNMHFIAPEYGTSISPSIDVYSFGMCALEMAALEIQGNGDSGNLVTDENVIKTIESLEDDQQKDFIYKCLNKDAQKRPSARKLLFHPLIFEVHSLKLLAAHFIVKCAANILETITDEVMQRLYNPDVVYAELRRYQPEIIVSGVVESQQQQQQQQQQQPHVVLKSLKVSDISVGDKLEKYLEDVRFGVYPLTAFACPHAPVTRSRAMSPELAESIKSATPEPLDIESRRIVNMMCNMKIKDDNNEILMTILLRMEDKINRQLTCQVNENDSCEHLAQELVNYGFINQFDRNKVLMLIDDTQKSFYLYPNEDNSITTTSLQPTTTIEITSGAADAITAAVAATTTTTTTTNEEIVSIMNDQSILNNTAAPVTIATSVNN